MRHNANRHVAIIGGGIGGLTAALAFAKSGAEVTVYEQAPALTEVGAGLQITPNGMRALYALGLEPKISEKGIVAQAVVPTDAISGRAIARFDLGRQRPPYRFFHRAELIDLLWNACAANGVQVKLGARISEIASNGSFQCDQQTISADLTIGADGVRSVARTVLNGASDPFFTGQVAWRATVPVKDAEPVATIWMAPGRHMVTYPLEGGRLNIVAVQERSQWAQEGWHHADDPGNLRHVFADCHWRLKSILSDVETVNLWGLFRHPVAPKWYQGSLAILGDAAHPTLPFLAQGANLAIEDAFELAQFCDNDADIENALSAYQDARKPRVTRAINAANANAKNYHLRGLKRYVAHAGLRGMARVAPDAFIGRLGWLYDYDVADIHR
ncbi:monooxygenase [Loktanella sp. S4079]|nr:monooxygenase [Loktanella sp. S4079]